ncbi:MAG: methylated-DNA--[protein]-cysteine S-methyltransferase [Peptococcaceae bacterium]|jgi:methylated-DNA-[protein]-cysteine S-methyltransferase|nr:methylated-DNA--[protein]-cysteine S-methyltransferase [Peptococcaceae bacterium]
MSSFYRYDTEIGQISIVESHGEISHILFDKDTPPEGAVEQETPLIKEAAKQLREYFAGHRHVFDLPLAPKGTNFQRATWQALTTIPYGETRSYKQIAEQIGSPKACRAVGLANNRNPIAIVIPCHRVIGANGKLVGYGGGLPIKKFLLELEERYK